MSDFASIVGWIVIIGGGLYAWASISDHLRQQQIDEANRRLIIKATAYRLALRQLYKQAQDNETRECIKQWSMHDGLTLGWAMLSLEDSDEKFREDNWDLGMVEAGMEIREKGYPVYIENGEIKTRW